MKKTLKKFIAAAVLLPIVVSASAVSVSAYDGDYHEFRDGDINLYLPDGWSSEELSDEWSSDGQFETILHAYDDSGETFLELDVVYGVDPVTVDDYIYFRDDEDEARRYYNTYGNDAISMYFSGAVEDTDYSEVTCSEFVHYAGECYDFFAVPVSVSYETGAQADPSEYLVYLTAEMADDDVTLVHNLLIFSLAGSAEAVVGEDAALAREIADGFYSYDYANVMAGMSEEAPSWTIDSDEISNIILELVTTLAMIGIILAMVFIIFKRLLGRKKAQVFAEAAPLFRKISKGVQRLQQGDAKRIFEKTPKKTEQSNSQWHRQSGGQGSDGNAPKQTLRKTTVQMRRREALGTEERYRESLKTLLKSGLLTRREMEEMLEKHQRNKEHQQRGR